MRQGFLSNPFLDQTYLGVAHIVRLVVVSVRGCCIQYPIFPFGLLLLLFPHHTCHFFFHSLYTPHLSYTYMTTSKAIQIAKDIEDARCKGNWKLMPELARRYRKHNPKGEGIVHIYPPKPSLLTMTATAVLAQTIVAEASLAQLVQNTQSSSSSSLLNADQVKSIRHQLQSVIHMTDTATATDREV